MSQIMPWGTRLVWGCKGLLALSVGAYMLLVGVDNVLYPGINLTYVQHVLSMDELQPWVPPSIVDARAITSPLFHKLAFWLIVSVEIIVGSLCLVAGGLMLVARTNRQFNCGKGVYFAGSTLCLLLWFVGFFTIGAEWFVMWASPAVGVQMKSLTMALFVLLSMVLVAQR